MSRLVIGENTCHCGYCALTGEYIQMKQARKVCAGRQLTLGMMMPRERMRLFCSVLAFSLLPSLLLPVELVMVSAFEVDGVRHISTCQHVCVSVSTGRWVRACDGGGCI